MSIEWPTVSIVMPVFNGATTIQRAIDSIRQQAYPNLELVVMDAGSTDGTQAILPANEDFLTWVSEPDQGQSDAINKGFARTSGKYINWLNADDFLYPGAIERAVSVFQANPGLGLVYGRLNLVNWDGSLKREWIKGKEGSYQDLLHWDNFIAQPGSLYTRKVWNVVGPLPIDLHYSMDWYLFLKIAEQFPIKYEPFIFAALSVYGTTKSSSGGLTRLKEYLRMLEANGSRAPLLYFKIGYWYYQHNQMQAARKNFIQSLRRGPKLYLRRQLISLILKTYLGARLVGVGRNIRRRLLAKHSLKV